MNVEAALRERERIRHLARMAWRTKRYGAVMLTPQEYRAMVAEQSIMQERRREYSRIQHAADAHLDAVIRADKADGTYRRKAHISGYYAAVRAQYVAERAGHEERVTHAQVANRMNCSRRNAAHLLQRASYVMAYFAMMDIPARWYWDEAKERWWLDAPVSRFSVSENELAA